MTERVDARTTCGGCWPGAGRWASTAFGGAPGLRRRRRSASAAVSTRRARNCSRRLDVVIAYRLLFGVYSGIVPDGIDDLVIDDIDWAGDATVLLSYVKGRTAAESLNLPRRAVRLLEQWLAHSELLRGLARPRARATACG